MKRRKRNIEVDEKETVIFRLWPPYSKRIVEQAKAARLTPNDFARRATMAMTDTGLLDLSERMKRLENLFIAFRRDFNEVVVNDRDTD